MPKNIVIFSDGTRCEGGKGYSSNVYKLYKMIEDRTPRQIAFYDRGLGRGWNFVAGSIGGMGISRNIHQCYEFIFDHYEVGDQIYLFGFSRGAATVRSLSGFIRLFGILPKSRPELIKTAYRIYKKKNPKRLALVKDFRRRHRVIGCRIRFLGVWDTVLALGLPWKSADLALGWIGMFKHDFHDFKLSKSVENGFQALAIDDERERFRPAPWNTRFLSPHQNVEQVWFCGMHSDIGGGYKKHELSDIALRWMAAHAEREDLLLIPDAYDGLTPQPNGHMHDSREGFVGGHYARAVRTWDDQNLGSPVVHPSAKQRTLNQRNEAEPPYKPWILEREHTVEQDPP